MRTTHIRLLIRSLITRAHPLLSHSTPAARRHPAHPAAARLMRAPPAC